MDYNATVPVRPEAADAVAATLAMIGNASSVHAFGRDARRVVEAARDSVATLVNASPASVVFTSGGTEANNLALRGTGRTRVLVSAIEHDSIRMAVPDTEIVPVDGTGRVQIDSLKAALDRDGAGTLISVMLANNETGILQPIADVAAVAREFGALVHCDAVQAAGKIEVDFGGLGVDMLSLSAHKIGGPQGVGALIVGDGVDLEPVLRGGGQEGRRRAGTENLPGIAGFGAAAEIVTRELAGYGALKELRDAVEAAVMNILPTARIVGSGVERLPNTSCIVTPGLPAESQVMALDLAGIAVSAGSACSSGKVTTSHVLHAMGLADSEAASAIRVSLGWQTTRSDVDRFVSAWRELITRAGKLPAAA
jgi:cysteine desulfurase